MAIFGASGPLAAAVTPLLSETHVLRLTDVLSPEQGAERIAGALVFVAAAGAAVGAA